MEKKMEPLVVKTGDGVIWIEQAGNTTDDDIGIAVSPDQVPLLTQWLQEAVKELEQKTRAK